MLGGLSGSYSRPCQATAYSEDQRARLVQRTKELTDRLRTITGTSKTAPSDNAVAQQPDNIDESYDGQDRQGTDPIIPNIASDTSDDGSTVERQTAKVFRDQDASNVGCFGA